jgi:hypothetical protein
VSDAEIVRYQPGELGEYDENRHDWNDVMAEAVGVGGADLLGKDLVDYLVDIPHCVVGVDFRQGEATKNGHDGAYVSLTALVAPADVIVRRFKGDLNSLPFEPEAVVVYNDGGTGIYRQVVKLLHANGFIGLTDQIKEGGAAGESTYDLHPAKWTGVDTKRVRVSYGDDGTTVTGIHANLRIAAPRGIRYSEYTVPGIGEAKTRYIG